MEDLTGKQLGPYQVIAPLGEGGMAAVYKAFQPGMDRYVALKILPPHFAKEPQFVARFQQEAKVLAQLQHSHILPVFDYGDADDEAVKSAKLQDKRTPCLVPSALRPTHVPDAALLCFTARLMRSVGTPAYLYWYWAGLCRLTLNTISMLVEKKPV